MTVRVHFGSKDSIRAFQKEEPNSVRMFVMTQEYFWVIIFLAVETNHHSAKFHLQQFSLFSKLKSKDLDFSQSGLIEMFTLLNLLTKTHPVSDKTFS